LDSALATGENWHFKGPMLMVKHRKTTYPCPKSDLNSQSQCPPVGEQIKENKSGTVAWTGEIFFVPVLKYSCLKT
jgi:hypothetical protein